MFHFEATEFKLSQNPSNWRKISLKFAEIHFERRKKWFFKTRHRPVLSTSLWTMPTNDHSAQFGAFQNTFWSMLKFCVSKVNFGKFQTGFLQFGGFWSCFEFCGPKMEHVEGSTNLKSSFRKGRNKLNYQIFEIINRQISRSLSLPNPPNPLFFPYKNNGRSGCAGIAPKSALEVFSALQIIQTLSPGAWGGLLMTYLCFPMKFLS